MTQVLSAFRSLRVCNFTTTNTCEILLSTQRNMHSPLVNFAWPAGNSPFATGKSIAKGQVQSQTRSPEALIIIIPSKFMMGSSCIIPSKSLKILPTKMPIVIPSQILFLKMPVVLNLMKFPIGFSDIFAPFSQGFSDLSKLHRHPRPPRSSPCSPKISPRG